MGSNELALRVVMLSTGQRTAHASPLAESCLNCRYCWVYCPILPPKGRSVPQSSSSTENFLRSSGSDSPRMKLHCVTARHLTLPCDRWRLTTSAHNKVTEITMEDPRMAAQVSIISIDTEPTQIYPQISIMVLLRLYHTAEHLLVLTLGCWSIHFICKNYPHLAL